MKILVLTKRRYTDKDLISDQYGRLFEIPAELNLIGHEVKGVALSYSRLEQGKFTWTNHPGLEWYSLNAVPWGLLNFRARLDKIIEVWKPDVVWACSDALIISLANSWAKSRKIPIVVDLYDNYESFKLSRIPTLKKRYRTACQQAAGLTAVSHKLLQKTKTIYNRNKSAFLLPNAVRSDLFHKRDKIKCRKRLNLPIDASIIGTAGAISGNRGIEDLFNAFVYLSNQNPDLWLAIAGPKDKIASEFKHPHIIDLGKIDFSLVPYFLSSLDVGVVCNKQSSFGQYCSPLKLMELLSSKVPVVAANVGDASNLLAERQDCLYAPGNWRQLAEKIDSHLDGFNDERIPEIKSWKKAAKELSDYFNFIIHQQSSIDRD